MRDLLCELEIPYVLRSVGRSQVADWIPPTARAAFAIPPNPETRNRRALLERSGRISVPYLADPNTKTELAESADIIAYLRRTYEVSPRS